MNEKNTAWTDLSLLSHRLDTIEYLIKRVNKGTKRLSIGLTEKPANKFERHEERHYTDVDNYLKPETVDLIRMEILKSLEKEKQVIRSKIKDAIT